MSNAGGTGEEEDEDEDEDEDEETLQLKLAQIEARLKLKKLQKAREARAQPSDSGANESSRGASRSSTSMSTGRAELPRPSSAVEVPMSPVRNRREPQEQRSPAKLLGIDKGLRAQDVSLKRAASTHARNSNTSSYGSSRNENPASKIKSFSQRIAESRGKDKEREEKQTRIEKSRSRGFGLKDLGVEASRDGASSRAAFSLSSGTRTTQDMFSPARNEGMGRGRTNAGPTNSQTPRPSSNHSSRPAISRAQSTNSESTSRANLTQTASKYAEILERDNTADAASFESFSRLHLKSRNMEHSKLTRVLEGKTVLTVPQLLKAVKAPDYDPPDIENDYVVFGVICSKSSPLTPKNARSNQATGNQDVDANQTGKFMVIKLTDLKWEVDLFLFDTGFSQFWKLPLGTLVAVLNPEIMPPRTRDTGRFSLKLASSDDTVLEVGTARDLDFCHAVRKDGKECGQWIDSRKTEVCDFHIELQLEKSKRGRMEVNTMSGTGFGKGGGKSGGLGGGSKSGQLRKEGMYHDSFLHETMYIAHTAGAAARLLDSDEQGFDRGASRAERYKKQLAEREKERELMKKLGEIGRGAAGDYMRVKGAGTENLPVRGETLTQQGAGTQESTDLAEDTLGLLSRRADQVSLAPVKRKRNMSGKSSASSEPVGWGGALKKGLLMSPKKQNPSTRDVREVSPAKKKARLLLPEKGIREPGRDSLGTMDIGLLAAMEDDDDDLEII
jgi:minichromosome maintenance protein 10